MRLTDILTTSSAVANFLGSGSVSPGHVLQAISILAGDLSMEDLGRPRSPLVRIPGAGSVDENVRLLAQKWWAKMGNDVRAEFDPDALAAFKTELEALAHAEQ